MTCAIPNLFPKAGRLRDWIVMRLARASAGLIATNQEDHNRLQSLPRRRLIPIGSSIPKAACGARDGYALPWRQTADAQTFVLGHFGFVKPVKGIDYLIEAMASLRGAGHDLRLLFIGEGRNEVDSEDDYLTKLEERIARLGLAEAIAWTGYLPAQAVAACFGAVDLMTLPYTDGASFRRSSLIAAIHSGCAILSTEPAVTVEPFEHGANLWLVAPCSSDAIEAGILRLMREPDLLARLRRGAARLRARFDWDGIARETIDFFQTLI